MRPFSFSRWMVAALLSLAAGSIKAREAPSDPDPVDALQEAVTEAASLTAARLISRNAFLAPPGVGQAYLSPDSRFVVHKEHRRKRVSLVLTQTVGLSTRTLLTSKAIGDISWLSDSSGIIFTTEGGVAIARVAGVGEPTLIQRFEHPETDRLVTADVSSPTHYFAQMYDASSKQTILYRLALDGTRQAIHAASSPILSLLQVHHQDRLFIATLYEGLPAILTIADGKTEVVLRCAYDEACQPVGYDADADELMVIANQEHNLSQLLAVGLGDRLARSIHKDPKSIADIDSVWADSVSGRPLLATYWRSNKTNYGLTTQIAEHIAHLEQHFGEHAHLSITPRPDYRAWLITEQRADRRDVAHYLYRPEVGAIMPLPRVVAMSDTLSPAQLSPVEPFTFTASDGMQIHAYLTLPRGVDAQAAPLVVLPHGGPWSRARGTYHAFNQLLANRGYLVYEPNFRSSSGYGREYIARANRDFGDGRVQDDIIEGLEYLLSHGIGDRQRLGVFGHSFGGFSTLAALAFTPQLFRVGIAGAPPANLGGTFLRMSQKAKFLRDNPLAPLVFEERLGRIDDIEAMRTLHAKSPLAHASNVERPLLIMAGKQDLRVSTDEVLEYAIAMESMDKPISLLIAEDEGHSYRQRHAREAYLYLLETLLAKHLGGRSEPLSADDVGHQQLARFVKKSMKIDRLGLVSWVD